MSGADYVLVILANATMGPIDVSGHVEPKSSNLDVQNPPKKLGTSLYGQCDCRFRDLF